MSVLLLIDDEARLPPQPTAAEHALDAKLGADGLAKIDTSVLAVVPSAWRKVARVIVETIERSKLSMNDDGVVDLVARRIVWLVVEHELEPQGDLRKPRFSEVRRAVDGTNSR
jgi:hypothetical protein